MDKQKFGGYVWGFEPGCCTPDNPCWDDTPRCPTCKEFDSASDEVRKTRWGEHANCCTPCHPCFIDLDALPRCRWPWQHDDKGRCGAFIAEGSAIEACEAHKLDAIDVENVCPCAECRKEREE